MYISITLVMFGTIVIDFRYPCLFFETAIFNIDIHDSTILVIFRTVVLAMDRFAGHIWDISNWSLFAILVIRFFCWSNLCLVIDDCRHDRGNMFQGFCLKSTIASCYN